MQVRRIKANVRCDMPLCRNKAVYRIAKEGLSASRCVNMCQGCVDKLQSELKRLAEEKRNEWRR